MLQLPGFHRRVLDGWLSRGAGILPEPKAKTKEFRNTILGTACGANERLCPILKGPSTQP